MLDADLLGTNENNSVWGAVGGGGAAGWGRSELRVLVETSTG